MGSAAVDLEKHRLALLAAKGDVVSGRAAASWALFAYERSNELKLLDSGPGGPDALARRFQNGSVMYGLCRLPGATAGQHHIILIHWIGEKVPEQRRQACAAHLPAIQAFFKEAQLVVKARQAEEVTQDGLGGMLSSVAPAAGAAPTRAHLSDSQDVGTNYQKTNPVLEILHTKRSSFWEQIEREEEERLQEECRRAKEERRRWERQRMEEERRQAVERERRIQEKEQLIQEQRKQQAQREAEERRQEEEARWGAAASVSHPMASPGGLFRPRAWSGSASGTQGLLSSQGGRPGTPRRPFLRYQRSLTESAYIFRHSDPPLGPSLGDFLPSGPPGSPLTAPLPSPRWSKLPPPISPKPGPRHPSRLLGSGPLPMEADIPPLSAPPAPQATPRASTLPATSPLAEGAIQVADVGGMNPLLPAVPGPPCTPLPPSPSCPPGPPRADTPPLCTTPPARSLPLPHHACLDSSLQAGPVSPKDGAQNATNLSSLTPPAGASPLTALLEEPVPPVVLSGPPPTCRLGQGGGAPAEEGAGGVCQSSLVATGPPDTPPPPEKEKEAPAGGSPAPAPDPSRPESAPHCSHNGVAAVEGWWWPQGQGPCLGSQGGSPTEAQVTEAAAQGPGTGDAACGPGKAIQEGGRGHTGDASMHTAAPALES